MKDYTGYEGLYAVTSCDKVWSYKREKFLKPGNSRGYLIVNLYKDGKYRPFYIHRLVAQAYLPNPDNLPQVNHKDECTTHNYLNNLEWVTAQENIDFSQAKAIYCVELDKTFTGLSHASKALGLSRNALQCCFYRGRKTCGGYHWKYV